MPLLPDEDVDAPPPCELELALPLLDEPLSCELEPPPPPLLEDEAFSCELELPPPLLLEDELLSCELELPPPLLLLLEDEALSWEGALATLSEPP